jgi:hypothetical protein
MYLMGRVLRPSLESKAEGLCLLRHQKIASNTSGQVLYDLGFAADLLVNLENTGLTFLS